MNKNGIRDRASKENKENEYVYITGPTKYDEGRAKIAPLARVCARKEHGDVMEVNFVRNTITALLFSPLIILIGLTALLRGKRKAALFWGPHVTSLAKRSLGFWVPEIESPEDFDIFRSKMRANLWQWRPFFDITIVEDTKDTFKINISNCPVCEVFKIAGLPGLNPYVCKGDWAKAEENKDKWSFEREHQIGTGDAFCDHAYKRKRL